MNMEPGEWSILTGAGFTKNFGCPLASEMWARIFNHPKIQASPDVRRLLLKDSDYESVYHAIIDGEFSDLDKEAITDAVSGAYDYVDSIIRDWNFRPDAAYPVNIYRLQELISRFSNQTGKCFVFTLNQDLFLERHYYNGERLYLPGITNDRNWFTTHFQRRVEIEDLVIVPTQSALDEVIEEEIRQHRFFYVKLHGSQNWIDSRSERKMVIGRGKAKQIDKTPLLSWYFDLFKRAVLEPCAKLLVIGYSFGDDHINSILARGTEEFGLRVYILDPRDPGQSSVDMRSSADKSKIWEGLAGYYPTTLLEMFPGDQSDSAVCKELYRTFFEDGGQL